MSQSVIEALRAEGHTVHRLGNHLPADAPDSQVIEKAQELGAILLSLNGDFSDVVIYPPSRYLGIIALQVKNHPEATAHLVARLLGYLSSHESGEALRGKLLVVEAHRIRIWE